MLVCMTLFSETSIVVYNGKGDQNSERIALHDTILDMPVSRTVLQIDK